VTTPTAQLNRTLERIPTHVRPHIDELRRLEQAGAPPGEIQQHRELITRLHSHITGLIRTSLAPPRDPPHLN
jgi:hypothetical protein